MKKYLIILLLFLSVKSQSQCRNTFLYGFELTDIPNPQLVTATVFYKGKAIVPKTLSICGKPVKIKTAFTYLKDPGKILNSIKLSYQLPGNRFYWMMTADMNIEMATNPDRFKIVLDTKDKALKANYEFPVTYDFVSQNAVYLDLLDKSEATMQQEWNQKIWKFAVSKKVIDENEGSGKDTSLIYTANNIPAGVVLRFPELRNTDNIHSVKLFNTAGFLFKQKLFLSFPESPGLPMPDAFNGLCVTTDGAKCALSGGLSGYGYGECAGAFMQKIKPVKYNVIIQIEPKQ